PWESRCLRGARRKRRCRLGFASMSGGRGIGGGGGRRRLYGDLSLLHGRWRRGTHAMVAEVEPIAAQLVAPVLALERPHLLVVLDLGRRTVLRGRGGGRGRRGELLLPAGDLEVEAQRLSE